MKKYLFLLLLSGMIAGCGDAEQKEEVLAFWKAQLVQILPKSPTAPEQVNPPEPVQEPLETPPNQPKEEAQANVPVKKSPVSQAKRPRVSYQYMEITMEEDPAKIAKKNTRASAKDRIFIQRALEHARQANQSALRDIGQIFGPETQAQAFAIVAQSENILQTSAQTAESAQKYITIQRKVLQQQEQLLNKLMQSNARKLRAVRG